MNDALAKALYYHLTTTETEVAAVVSVRVYPQGRVPHNPTMPYVVYQQVGGAHLRDCAGGVGEARTRIQLDVWAATDATLRTLTDALREALDNYTGNMGEAGATVPVRHCGLSGDYGAGEDYPPGEEGGPLRGVQDYTICHTESATP